MRLKSMGYYLDYLRQQKHLAHQGQFRLGCQQRDITTFANDFPLFGKAQDTGDAGMGILDIVHGVVHRLFFSQFQVEVHLAIGGAG